MILISLHFPSIKQEHTVEYPCILALKLVLCYLVCDKQPVTFLEHTFK